MTTCFRWIQVPAVLSLVALAAGCGGSTAAAKTGADATGGGTGAAEVGKPAPDLSIQTLNGKGKVSIESSQGKILVVDFWATWCGPCKQSFPKLEELSKKVGDKVEVIGISVDDESKGILDFAKENGATFAIGWDEGHAIALRWNVKNMPTTFIVDGSGKVRFIHAGYHDGETATMEKELAELAHESPSTTAVAKTDEKKSDEKKDEKTDEKKDAKDDRKSDEKKDGVAATGDEDKGDTPPKKKGGKKGGAKGASKGAGKKPAKKKS